MTWKKRKMEHERDVATLVECTARPLSDVRPRFNLDTGALYALCSQMTYSTTAADNEEPSRTYTLLAELGLPVRELGGLVADGSPLTSTIPVAHHRYDLVISTPAWIECTKLFGERAGVVETRRLEWLLEHVATVVPPLRYGPLDRLPESRRVTPVDKFVFGTGMAYAVPTVTCDAQFVRRCRNLGVALRCVVLPPCRLTGY
jgi:hypothetical protein